MTVEYTYNVQKLNVIKWYEYNNVVVFAVMTVEATDGVNKAFIGFGQEFTLDESKPFTPYEELTEEQVIQWVKGAAGPEKIAQLEAQAAENLANATAYYSPQLPWREQS